jgi:general transcription factor 3C polypeptide 4
MGHPSRSPKIALGDAPIHSLRSVFMHLRKNGTLRRIHSRVLDILRRHDDDDDSSGAIIVPPSSTGLGPGMKLQFRRCLTSHLFGWDKVLSLRMKLAVADFCWVSLFVCSLWSYCYDKYAFSTENL